MLPVTVPGNMSRTDDQKRFGAGVRAALCRNQDAPHLWPISFRVFRRPTRSSVRMTTSRLASVIAPRNAIDECAAVELLKRIRQEPIDRPVIDLGYQIDTGGTL